MFTGKCFFRRVSSKIYFSGSKIELNVYKIILSTDETDFRRWFLNNYFQSSSVSSVTSADKTTFTSFVCILTVTPMTNPLFHVVLFQPEIPDNTGAVGRTCVAIGAKLWLVRPLGFQIDHRRIKRAGLDYWQHLDVEIVDDWENLTRRLAGKNFWFLSKKAEALYTATTFEKDDVFVFGCESMGLPKAILEENRTKLLKIPILPEARSLNLSVSVGVTLFEAYRQVTVFPQ